MKGTSLTPPRHSTINGSRHSSLSPSNRLQSSIERSALALTRLQNDDGHWVGELQGDTILESEYIMLMAFLGREHDEKCRKAAKYILSQQLEHGAWSNYPDGPPDVSVSTKAYFALKLTGEDPNSPAMTRARDIIRDIGGAEACNSFTRFYLALLGQIPYDNCPAVPPEIILMPRWFYFNIYAMSSWTRTILVPLSIFYAHKPCRKVDPSQGIGELYLESASKRQWVHPPTKRLFSWTNFFLGVDWLAKKLDPGKWLKPLRRLALRKAVAWMREHFKNSDGVGAIFPPMIYTVICLRCLGVPDDDPEMQWAMQQLDDLMIEENGTLRLQPCHSPVWDTALTLNALAGLESKNPEVTESIELGIDWILSKEVRQKGDWSISNSTVEPAGWFFEYNNAYYPDMDDTAMVLKALAKTNSADSPKARGAVERGLRWLLAMQSRDGGWAAFDRDIDREILTQVPFADHNAMLDPSCPDITARVLECLGYYGFGVQDDRVGRALRFIEKTQDERGCWIGRWGVNYIYGTWQVLQGLESIGYDMQSSTVRRAVDWLKSVQQPSGAWGESCASYDDPQLAGQGKPTASQTAWALLALLAAGEAKSDAVQDGIDYLVRNQRADGNWQEDLFTGTGFPKVFYLKYHMYSLYFPLMALTKYRAATSASHQLKTYKHQHIAVG